MIIKFATLNAFVASVKASIANYATYTGTTIFAGGASATVYFSSGQITGYQNTNYIGVPGPDLAAGLPVITIAAAYAAYRYFRNSRNAV